LSIPHKHDRLTCVVGCLGEQRGIVEWIAEHLGEHLDDKSEAVLVIVEKNNAVRLVCVDSGGGRQSHRAPLR